MWSAGISVESYARLASRVYSRGDRFLYGYYNSEQQFVQVNFVQTISRRLRSNQIWCIILSMKHFWREVYAKRQFFQSLCSAVGFAEVQ